MRGLAHLGEPAILSRRYFYFCKLVVFIANVFSCEYSFSAFACFLFFRHHIQLELDRIQLAAHFQSGVIYILPAPIRMPFIRLFIVVIFGILHHLAQSGIGVAVFS